MDTCTLYTLVSSSGAIGSPRHSICARCVERALYEPYGFMLGNSSYAGVAGHRIACSYMRKRNRTQRTWPKHCDLCIS